MLEGESPIVKKNDMVIRLANIMVNTGGNRFLLGKSLFKNLIYTDILGSIIFNPGDKSDTNPYGMAVVKQSKVKSKNLETFHPHQKYPCKGLTSRQRQGACDGKTSRL